MTQPQYGYAPQQGYGPPQGGYQTYDPNPQASQGAYPPPQYGPPPAGYAPGYYPPGTGQGQPQWNGQQVPQQPQQPQGAKGTLEDWANQPSQGAGKGLTWNQVPNGYTYVGVVQRTPIDGDLFQDSDPKSGQLKTFRDGSPKLVLPVQLRIHQMDQMQQMNYPEGDARLFLRGGLRDEINRAMAEAGDSGVPKAGALIIVTLTHRKPGNNIATNVYAVQYYPAGTWEQNFSQYTYLMPGNAPQAAPAPQQQAPAAAAPYGGAPQQAPYQQQAQPASQAPVPGPAQYGQQQAAPNPQQYAQAAPLPQGQAAQYGGQAYDPNPQQAPVNQPPPGVPAAGPNPALQQPHVQQELPIPQQGAVQPPAQPPAPPVQPGVLQSALPPEKQALLARMQGQQG